MLSSSFFLLFVFQESESIVVVAALAGVMWPVLILLLFINFFSYTGDDVTAFLYSIALFLSLVASTFCTSNIHKREQLKYYAVLAITWYAITGFLVMLLYPVFEALIKGSDSYFYSVEISTLTAAMFGVGWPAYGLVAFYNLGGLVSYFIQAIFTLVPSLIVSSICTSLIHANERLKYYVMLATVWYLVTGILTVVFVFFFGHVQGYSEYDVIASFLVSVIIGAAWLSYGFQAFLLRPLGILNVEEINPMVALSLFPPLIISFFVIYVIHGKRSLEGLFQSLTEMKQVDVRKHERVLPVERRPTRAIERPGRQKLVLARQQKEEEDERLHLERMKKIESLIRMADRILVEDLSDLLGLSRSVLLDSLLSWSEQFPLRLDGEYIVIADELRKNKARVKEFTETITRATTCYHCGAILEKGTTTCPSCSEPVFTCGICKRTINFTDIVGECLYCGHGFHYSHLQETIKVTGLCPVCKQSLKEDEVVRKEKIAKK